MRFPILTFALLASAWPLITSAQDGPPALRNNPFSRPPSDVIIDDRVSVRTEETVNTPLELQATMIGTVNKLANVDGRILKPGDEIQGHMLVAVHERYAVFRRNGKDTTVYVKPQLAENQMAENDE